MNIWHDIDEKSITPEQFYAVVEIPAGSKKKYEIDKKTGSIKLDRVLNTSTHFPWNYGFIPRTYSDNNDPLDVLVLCTESLSPLVLVECYPIGVIRMSYEGYDEFDDKIIAIPIKDPTWNFYTDIDQLPPHISNEIIHFFEVYKAMEVSNISVSEILDKDAAKQVISNCMDNYQIHFCGKVK